MVLDTNSTVPIYIQIAEWIENEILEGQLKVDDKVYSQYKLADMFTINPATAAKGLNLLYEENVLYNKRGLGKFVSQDAMAIILEKRKNQKLKGLLEEAVLEAARLQVNDEELVEMLLQLIKTNKGE
ncbi:GntR family transcriptional regulator [Ornithinibacillus halotolerans]|uniref:GntR family transcriptional regulator n=1 Tax=Ornithinibacillus halotolerans TaxID=1274357 RepID=A0A916W8H4_9BACI|nr:GntR family transcriptional regulator [Ornithinibacillus halotolerans]GGA77806.1 GntR family transcriptional regulator [Ornithinibacillus halotolerans]